MDHLSNVSAQHSARFLHKMTTNAFSEAHAGLSNNKYCTSIRITGSVSEESGYRILATRDTRQLRRSKHHACVIFSKSIADDVPM